MICPDCSGSGVITLFTSSKPCAKCGGTGKVTEFTLEGFFRLTPEQLKADLELFTDTRVWVCKAQAIVDLDRNKMTTETVRHTFSVNGGDLMPLDPK